MATKRCSACGIEKPLTEFGSNRTHNDGLDSACKSCRKEQRRRSDARSHRVFDGWKQCSRCKLSKIITEFSANSRMGDGLANVCKACAYPLRAAYGQTEDGKQKIIEGLRRRWRGDPDRKSETHLNRVYGLPLGSYARMLAAQNGGCAICESQPNGNRLHVDHCHETNTVRGLLCGRCNRAIGLLLNSPELASKAAAYLKNPPHQS